MSKTFYFTVSEITKVSLSLEVFFYYERIKNPEN